jgi:hypothetical protein
MDKSKAEQRELHAVGKSAPPLVNVDYRCRRELHERTDIFTSDLKSHLVNLSAGRATELLDSKPVSKSSFLKIMFRSAEADLT